MDPRTMNSKNLNLIKLIAWTIVVSSIISCSSRADYNIAIGYLILLLRSLTSTEKLKLGTKGCIHIILVSIIFDIIWIIQYYSYWRHGEDTSDLWKSLSLIHNVAYYLGIFEFLLKLPTMFFLYKQFNSLGGELKELISLKYSK